ncbi:MAG: DUF3365 domain-containing protein [Melioribacteraceae bacterium]|nr:DUF3365 domain-containing protein [Melioribacteraceae bacterium]
MRVFSLIIFLSIGLFLNSCNKEDNVDNEKYKAELSGYAKEYMVGLKTVLVKNMQEGGPLKAINVCSDTAADMTQIYSEKNNVIVKRASFKNRNENNKPDWFEEKAIAHFSDLLNSGQLSADASLIENVKIDDINFVKFAKPILVEAPCLNCHGSEAQISENVNEVLKAKYPEDKAIGYAIGDLRGVISVTKSLIK